MVIRNGSALSRLKIYKLQSDYVDEIQELNLSTVTTLVTALCNAPKKGFMCTLEPADSQRKTSAAFPFRLLLFTVEIVSRTLFILPAQNVFIKSLTKAGLSVRHTP